MVRRRSVTAQFVGSIPTTAADATARAVAHTAEDSVRVLMPPSEGGRRGFDSGLGNLMIASGGFSAGTDAAL